MTINPPQPPGGFPPAGGAGFPGFPPPKKQGKGKLIAAIVGGLLLFGGCVSALGGGGDDKVTAGSGGPETKEPATAAPKATTAPAKSKAPAKPKASRCLPVSLADLQRLAEGAEDDVGTITFSEGAAVKSKDFESVYMFAGRFSAPGVKDEVGVWASNKIVVGEGLILSVDGFAKQFTVWPDADETEAGIEQSNDGVEEAKDCLG